MTDQPQNAEGHALNDDMTPDTERADSDDTAPASLAERFSIWMHQHPHAMPLMWLCVLFVGHGFAVNFYLGLWRYGELGLVPGINSYTFPILLLVFVVAGARGYLRRVDPLDSGLCLLALVILMSTFPGIKSTISLVQPYYADAELIRLDTLLFGGQPPHILLERIIGYPWVYRLIGVAYYLYYGLCVLAAGFVIFTPPGHTQREAFMITYLASWYVNGVILATLFASVGPIFLDDFYHGTLAGPYRQALDQLCSLSITTCDIRKVLMDWYQLGPISDFNGPSAFPSMHVSTTFLVVLYIHNNYRRFAAYAWLMSAMILIGSVLLLWHYAVDDIASLLTTWIIWRLSLAWMKHRQPVPVPVPAPAISDARTASQPPPDPA